MIVHHARARSAMLKPRAEKAMTNKIGRPIGTWSTAGPCLCRSHQCTTTVMCPLRNNALTEKESVSVAVGLSLCCLPFCVTTPRAWYDVSVDGDDGNSLPLSPSIDFPNSLHEQTSKASSMCWFKLTVSTLPQASDCEAMACFGEAGVMGQLPRIRSALFFSQRPGSLPSFINQLYDAVVGHNSRLCGAVLWLVGRGREGGKGGRSPPILFIS